jgi:hypothetical protein
LRESPRDGAADQASPGDEHIGHGFIVPARWSPSRDGWSRANCLVAPRRSTLEI